MHFEKLEMVNLVNEAVKSHEATASTRKQTITFNSNGNQHVYVPGDISSLTEVLNNLIGNALKYTDNGGEVKVNVLVDGDKARIEVVDDGPGITQENRAKLFTKFYRVERSLVAGNRGTGLGLYLSKSIIDQHHGEIGVAPYSAGHGSTFYFTLPIFNQELHGKLVSKNKVTGGPRGWFKKRDDRRG